MTIGQTPTVTESGFKLTEAAAHIRGPSQNAQQEDKESVVYLKRFRDGPQNPNMTSDQAKKQCNKVGVSLLK